MTETQNAPLGEQDEFKKAAQPLMDYLAAKHHPHVYATVDSEAAMLVEGLQTVRRD